MEGNIRDIQLNKLNERAKELKCIYQVCEALRDEKADLIKVFKSILDSIPPGYQYPTVCEARINFEGKQYSSTDFKETEWIQRAEIVIDNHISGEIQVCYIQDVFEPNRRIFLPEEQKLLNTIADHLSRYIFQRRLKKTLELSLFPENGADYNGESSLLNYESDEHWKWRLQVAEKIAGMMDMERFGVEAVYLIGSTKSGQAGPGSDIDLLLHFRGKPAQEKELRSWLEGWGLGLAELNYHKTGYVTSGSLIDLHILTDEAIKARSSYAVMIGSVENSARLLRSRKIRDD
ncbi:MAG TPA: nucleotidyltransferase domain-containing protein [Bacteroidales bacterium]|nr:nucleotidyltransferase domain-containing protein [Bacteroidales bacterium]